MNDKTDKNKKTSSTLTISSAGKLQLAKAIEGGQIRQSFAHGRSKTVTVEVKKSRSLTRDSAKQPEKETIAAEDKLTDQKVTDTVDNEIENYASLTEHERSARLQALKHASEKESYKSLFKEPEKIEDLEEEPEDAVVESITTPQEAELTPAAVEPATVTAKPTTPTAIDLNKSSQQPAALNIEKTSQDKPAAAKTQSTDEDYDEDIPAKKRGHHSTKPASVAKKPSLKHDAAKAGKTKWDDLKRLSGKIALANVGDDEEDGRGRSLASLRRAKEKAKRRDIRQQPKEIEKISRDVILPEFITVQDLANRMSEKSTDVIKELMKLGTMAAATQSIDADTAELIAQSLGHKVKRVTESDVENILTAEDDTPESMVKRAPVVTIMGHVDHGKTTLLDALRSTDVASGEAGGITQHIGAYQVTLASGEHITFLDTPGHEAFTAMRARGAKVTDIVVLVVAADDGIMAQTVEALNHAKAANLPIIVAINKIDKPDADPQRVRNELLNHGLVSEELGGDTMVVEVSAKSKTNLDKLEETILLQAEMLDLKANPSRKANGAVVEAKLDKGRGVVATLLVQKGTLGIGDIIVAGASFGKVRAMYNDKGLPVKEAIPSYAVEVIGLSDAPDAGDTFAAVQTEKQARDICEYRIKRLRDSRTAHTYKTNSLEDLLSRTSPDSKIKELPVIIKADVHGSVEAISNSLEKLSNEEVRVRVLHGAVGGITESDVILAKASRALIIGFNVRANTQAKQSAEHEGINIRYYSIIYDLVNEVKAAMSGMLAPTIREEYLGTAEIRQVISTDKFGKIAGSYITDGTIKRNAKVRLLRDNIVIYEGKIKSLRRFKEDVREVKEGFECGITLENYDDIKERDIIEAFELVEEKKVLQ